GAGLDLDDDADFFVGAGEVVLDAPVAARPRRGGDAANAVRRIPGGGYRTARLVRGLDERHEQALHAEVEEALEEDRIVPGRTHDRRGRARLHRLQLAVHVRELVGRVLGVEQQPVEPDAGDDLG